MNNIINVIGIGIILLLYCKKKYNLFFAMVFIELLIFPTINIKNAHINNSYLIGLILFIIVLKSKSLVIDKLSLTYFIVGLIIIAFGSIGWFINGKPSIKGIISIAGIIKNISIVVFLSALYNKDYKVNNSNSIINIMDIFILIMLSINSVAVFMQIFIPKFSSKFFYRLYFTPNNTPLTFPFVHGVFQRMYGTFPSPAEFGLVLYIIFAYLFMQFLLSDKKKYTIYLVICFVLGISSLTKSFMLGSVLIIIISLIMKYKLIVKSKEVRVKLLKLIMVVVFVFVGAYVFFTYKKFPIDYYAKFLLNPIQALETRYSNGGNITFKVTYEIIKEHPLIGVGFEQLKGEFLGDSSYVVMLHDGGIMALSTLVIMELILLIKFWKQKNDTALNILFALITGSLAATLMYSSDAAIPFLFYIANNELHKKDNLMVLYDKNSAIGI